MSTKQVFREWGASEVDVTLDVGCGSRRLEMNVRAESVRIGAVVRAC